MMLFWRQFYYHNYNSLFFSPWTKLQTGIWLAIECQKLIIIAEYFILQFAQEKEREICTKLEAEKFISPVEYILVRLYFIFSEWASFYSTFFVHTVFTVGLDQISINAIPSQSIDVDWVWRVGLSMALAMWSLMFRSNHSITWCLMLETSSCGCSLLSCL